MRSPTSPSWRPTPTQWRDRTRFGKSWRRSSASEDPNATARQFVAVDASGAFVGTAVALIERVGDEDVFGLEIARLAGQLVGVYVAPSHRGRGVIEQLTAACFAWIGERDLSVARLFVHAENGRAQRVYERLGFTRTG